jgi:hypothetical protein
MILTDEAVSHILNCTSELNRRIEMSNKPWPEWNQDIERRREAMNHELSPPPTRSPTVFKDPTGGTYLSIVMTMDKQAFAYARVCIEPLQARIAELEVQLAHLTASLETVSAACIVLKQQQREGWAKLASGQEPVAWQTFDGEGGYEFRQFAENKTYHDDYIKRNGEKYSALVTPLYTHPAPAQHPLSKSDAVDAARYRYCLQHGWPECRRQIHPTVEALHWGYEDGSQYPSPTAAIDAAMLVSKEKP